MKNIKQQTILNKLLLTILFVLATVSFTACSDDDTDKDEEQKQVYIGQLTQMKNGLEYLIDYSDFGYKQGQYPIESKEILSSDFDEITQLISDINLGKYNLSEIDVKVKEAIAKANRSIEAFNATLRISDAYDQSTIDKLGLLQEKRIALVNMRDNSTYGNYQGQYPTESKSILQQGIDDLYKLIQNIENFDIVSPTQEVIEEAITNADLVITNFEASVRLVDNIKYNLFVDGVNNGYINFEYNENFVKFGNQSSQAFTIATWVKITGTNYVEATGNTHNGAILSAFDQNSASPAYFSGWMICWRKESTLRSSVGVVDVNNNDRHLWEPGKNMNIKDQWVHVVIVYNDLGLDDRDNRARIYINGDDSGTIRIGEVERVYNSNQVIANNVKMTAFVQYINGTKMGATAGYMKSLQIWKTNKSGSEIKAMYNGNYDLDLTDSNLVSAWNFETKPADGINIVDLTGRYTATIVGTHQWVEQ